MLSLVLSCDFASSGTRMRAGKRVVTMSEGIIVWTCPGCGQPIDTGADYVVAREHPLPSDFTLHMNGHEDEGTTRRFHVEHFRGRLGDHVYELIDAQRSG